MVNSYSTYCVYSIIALIANRQALRTGTLNCEEETEDTKNSIEDKTIAGIEELFNGVKACTRYVNPILK